MENHLLFTLISFVFFTALVGVIAAKMVTSDDQTTSKGYFLADSKLPILRAGEIESGLKL